MDKRKFKKIVVPTIYTLSITAVFLSIILLGKTFNSLFSVDNNEKEVIDVIDKPSVPVVNVEEDKQIIKPFTNEGITVIKNFYNKNADEKQQQESIIYYENTYMQSTGVLYSNQEQFDVIAVLDGTVSNIKEDDLLGKIVEIKHNTNLTTIYQSLGDVDIKVGNAINQGDKVGISGTNKIDTTSENQLLFEVYHKGLLLDPIEFYNMKIEDLSE